MRAEHWFLLAGLLGIIGGLEDVQQWADLINVKIVLKMAASAAILIRTAYVPPRP